MSLANAQYDGNWAVQCTHGKNNTNLTIDAQNGFSPTELVATALGACAAMTMGYYARKHHFSVEGISFSIDSNYNSQKNAIESIDIVFSMPKLPFTPEQKEQLERVAHKCPVKKSLTDDIAVSLRFEWS